MASVHQNTDTKLLHGQEEEEEDSFIRNNVFKCMANCTNAHKWMKKKEEEKKSTFINLCENHVCMSLCH